MVKFQKMADADMQAVIGHVMPDSPAAKAGIQDGDRIVRIDGKANPTWEDVGLQGNRQRLPPDAPDHRAQRQALRHHGDARSWASAPAWASRAGTNAARFSWARSSPACPPRRPGCKKGDLLITVNGQPIHSLIKFQEITKNSGGKPIEIEYQRDKEQIT